MLILRLMMRPRVLTESGKHPKGHMSNTGSLPCQGDIPANERLVKESRRVVLEP